MKIPTKQVKSPKKKRSLKSVKSVKEVVNAAQLPNELTLALGLNVQHYRKEMNLTQVNLAYDAEVERSRISKIETGLVNLADPRALDFCVIGQIDLREIQLFTVVLNRSEERRVGKECSS